jgi:HEAT repeat protein
MKKLLGISLVLLAGCGTSDRPTGTAGGAIMSGHTTSEWIQDLKSPDAEKRKLAVTVLRDHARTDLGVREELLQALKSDDSDIKVGVAGVFAAMGWDGEDALPNLKVMYLDKDERVSNAAVEAIRTIDEKELPKIGVSRGKIAK